MGLADLHSHTIYSYDGTASVPSVLARAQQIGLDVIAVAAVSLEDHHPDSVREFDAMVANRPEILECYAMSGQYDYHLKVVCKSIKAYEKLLRAHIMPCKAVHHVNTSFVLRSNKYTTALPLEE